MTAVTLPAEARRRASRMMKSSIRCSFTGGDVGWITNTSCPRIESSILTLISPSGKCLRRGSVSGTSSFSEMRAARSGLALPAISLRAPQGEDSSPANSTAVVNLPITLLSVPRPFRGRGFPPYHPSWNSDCCRAVRDVFCDHRAGPGSRAPANLDGSDQHRVDTDEGAVADLGAVLVGAVEVGRDRARPDVGLLAKVRVAEIRNVRHLAVPPHLRPHELGEAADVDVLGDLGARPDLHERTAVGAVADLRVLYVHVWSDAAVAADFRVALDDRERLDGRVLSDGHVGVDEGRIRIDDGDALRHMAVEDAPAHDPRRGGETHAVLDANRLSRVLEPHDIDRRQVKEDIGEVILGGFVVVRDGREGFLKTAAVEAVNTDVELVDAFAQLFAGVLSFDDLLELSVLAAHDAPVVAIRVFDAGERGRPTGLPMGVNDAAHGARGQERRVAVDHEDVSAEALDLLQGVRRASRLSLVDDLDPLIPLGQVRGDLGVVRVGDDLDRISARFSHRVEDPIDHGAAAEDMQHLGSPRPHAGAVAGGQDD